MFLAVLLLSQIAHPAFDAKLDKLAATAGPGVAMSVYQNGKPVYQKTYGLADVASLKPYRLDTPFEIGSLSKQFTATAILMLVKGRKLELTDPIGKYLEGIPPAWKVATIKQVLHHMSGIPDYEEIAGYDFYNKERKPEEVIAEAAKKPLDFQPGEKFSYSNTGYFLLGMIVTKASGIEVGEFLERRVFRPVGMRNTYAIHGPEGVIPAMGYHSRTGTRTVQPPIAWTSSLGAGAIVSTLEDMNKWDQALYTEKLLPAKLREQLWSTATTTAGEPVNYGYGWFSGSYRGLERKDHSGQTNGFTCYYFRFPAQRTMIMVHTNTYGGDVDGIANTLSAHFVPGASYLMMKVPADPQPATTAEHLAMLKTSILGDSDMENFSPGIKDFATKDNFKSLRDELKPAIATLKSFRLLVHRSPRAGSEVYIYRHEYEAKTFFLTMRFQDGKLSGLNWEDE